MLTMIAMVEPIWKKTVPEMETVSSVILATVDDYTTTMQLMTIAKARTDARIRLLKSLTFSATGTRSTLRAFFKERRLLSYLLFFI